MSITLHLQSFPILTIRFGWSSSSNRISWTHCWKVTPSCCMCPREQVLPSVAASETHQLINTTRVCQEEGRKIAALSGVTPWACKAWQKGDAGGITMESFNMIINREHLKKEEEKKVYWKTQPITAKHQDDCVEACNLEAQNTERNCINNGWTSFTWKLIEVWCASPGRSRLSPLC